MSEAAFRLTIFFGVLTLMALWEIAAPWRGAQKRPVRWPGNLGIVVLDSLLVRLVFPLTATGVALLAEARGWGLMNVFGVPAVIGIFLSVLVLDLAIFLQHVAFHRVPLLWRLHRMHHADPVLDVTTGLRFHPFEILVSMAIKFAVVLALGAPALAVVIFEVLLNATAMFNHANVRLPSGIERRLRWILVTPDMHRVHHSVLRPETDSNYGFNLPWWDRLFGTYRQRPEAGPEHVQIGIGVFDQDIDQRLDRLLAQPFRANGWEPE